MTTLVLDTKYEITFDDDYISQTGIDRINELIRSQQLRSVAWEKFLPDKNANGEKFDVMWIGNRSLPPLPDNWEWRRNHVPADKRNPIRGYFSKRLEQYYRTEYGFKGLPDGLKAHIGTLVDENVDLNSNHVIQVTRNLDWEAGDFGDSGSCFWGGRKDARFYLKKIEAFAIQSFDPNDWDSGIGRCWMIPDFPEDGCFCLFNGYGYGNGNDALRIISKVFAKHIGGEQKKITLKNQGNDSGVMFINGARASIVAPLDVLRTVKEDETYDLNFKLDKIGRCVFSDETIFEGDDYVRLASGGMMLEEYVDEHAFTCPICEGVDLRTNAYEVRTSRYEGEQNFMPQGRVMICSRCSDRNLVFDELEHDRILIEDAVFVNGDGITTHRDTLHNTCGICSITERAFLKKNLVTLHNGQTVSIGAYYHLRAMFEAAMDDPDTYLEFQQEANEFLEGASATTLNALISELKDNGILSLDQNEFEQIFSVDYMQALAYMNTYEVTYA